ncbi:MAG: 50S ribosomal protein L15, partial [Candidatus Omnitrophica bacterium]|nr:50S ribosomal protein L15 [Candidatus Omnitrophota bacterium]
MLKTKKTVKAEPKAEKSVKQPIPAQEADKSVYKIGLHNLRAPFGSHKKRKLLGRGAGSGHGKTSTRGSKGATSRSGPGVYLGHEGGQSPLIRKMPKRGFNSRTPLKYQVVNLESLVKIKEDIINPSLLLEKGFIKSKSVPVKILGNGEL